MFTLKRPYSFSAFIINFNDGNEFLSVQTGKDIQCNCTWLKTFHCNSTAANVWYEQGAHFLPAIIAHFVFVLQQKLRTNCVTAVFMFLHAKNVLSNEENLLITFDSLFAVKVPSLIFWRRTSYTYSAKWNTNVRRDGEHT